MVVTLRNIDAGLFRAFKAKAASQGRTIGDMLNDVLREVLIERDTRAQISLGDLKPIRFAAGNERLSDEIDEVLYGRSP